jgi:hypothetical protein
MNPSAPPVVPAIEDVVVVYFETFHVEGFLEHLACLHESLESPPDDRDVLL